MKAKVQIKSIFEQIAEKSFSMTNLQEIKTFVTEFVESKNINSVDKNTILTNVDIIVYSSILIIKIKGYVFKFRQHKILISRRD